MEQEKIEALIREVATLRGQAPGLARLMPEVGVRFTKCAYAARAGSFDNAAWQLREGVKLLRLCALNRPKYAPDIDEYLEGWVRPLTAAIGERDGVAFEEAFQRAVDRGNEYHDQWGKGHIQWVLPDEAPLDIRFIPDQPSA